MIRLRQGFSALFAFCTFAISVIAPHASADNALSAEEKAAGWELLFDGESMNHWRNYQREDIRQQWTIEESSMVLTGGGGGDLITRKQYQDFDLKLDWKISEGGNSGIFFYADEAPERIYHNGTLHASL